MGVRYEMRDPTSKSAHPMCMKPTSQSGWPSGQCGTDPLDLIWWPNRAIWKTHYNHQIEWLKKVCQMKGPDAEGPCACVLTKHTWPLRVTSLPTTNHRVPYKCIWIWKIQLNKRIQKSSSQTFSQVWILTFATQGFKWN